MKTNPLSDLTKLQAELTKLKLDLTTNQLKNTSLLKKKRAEIARLKTASGGKK